ncbi:hypothetical protein K437DRAFT_39944 [Tilletiaria anomala UBC 951]|uniref:Uncharacterized protein n=1 Tax=Tilletiaria anomala (strain ATCC 24038 / CBS 436.72 / UBC 951) TaxID=1037660 RepID=A0A066WM67_TILAU|nr:uncharacterized protein K437DRAFT_39944 [Tilletiaria anomala UBC 951]KDN52094.1 hypothetical protein K437DRAFT_39944 [Tilletiaria anomala UBC 951]
MSTPLVTSHVVLNGIGESGDDNPSIAGGATPNALSSSAASTSGSVAQAITTSSPATAASTLTVPPLSASIADGGANDGREQDALAPLAADSQVQDGPVPPAHVTADEGNSEDTTAASVDPLDGEASPSQSDLFSPSSSAEMAAQSPVPPQPPEPSRTELVEDKAIATGRPSSSDGVKKAEEADKKHNSAVATHEHEPSGRIPDFPDPLASASWTLPRTDVDDITLDGVIAEIAQGELSQGTEQDDKATDEVGNTPTSLDPSNNSSANQLPVNESSKAEEIVDEAPQSAVGQSAIQLPTASEAGPITYSPEYQAVEITPTPQSSAVPEAEGPIKTSPVVASQVSPIANAASTSEGAPSATQSGDSDVSAAPVFESAAVKLTLGPPTTTAPASVAASTSTSTTVSAFAHGPASSPASTPASASVSAPTTASTAAATEPTAIAPPTLASKAPSLPSSSATSHAAVPHPATIVTSTHDLTTSAAPAASVSASGSVRGAPTPTDLSTSVSAVPSAAGASAAAEGNTNATVNQAPVATTARGASSVVEEGRALEPSPEEAKLQSQVAVLLKINKEILRACVAMQNTGRISIPLNMDLTHRLQSNLSFLAFCAEKSMQGQNPAALAKPVLPRLDLIQDSSLPPESELPLLYKQLQALFRIEFLALQQSEVAKGKKRAAPEAQNESQALEANKRQATLANGYASQMGVASGPSATAPNYPGQMQHAMQGGAITNTHMPGQQQMPPDVGARLQQQALQPHQPGTSDQRIWRGQHQYLGNPPSSPGTIVHTRSLSQSQEVVPGASTAGSQVTQQLQAQAQGLPLYPAPAQAQSPTQVFSPNAANNYAMLQTHLRGQPQALVSYLEQNVPNFRNLPLQSQLSQMAAMQNSAAQRHRQAQLMQAQKRASAESPPPAQSPYGTPPASSAMQQPYPGVSGSPSNMPAKAIAQRSFTPSPRMAPAHASVVGMAALASDGSRPSTPRQAMSNMPSALPGSATNVPGARARGPSSASVHSDFSGAHVATNSPLRQTVSPAPISQSPVLYPMAAPVGGMSSTSQPFNIPATASAMQQMFAQQGHLVPANQQGQAQGQSQAGYVQSPASIAAMLQQQQQQRVMSSQQPLGAGGMMPGNFAQGTMNPGMLSGGYPSAFQSAGQQPQQAQGVPFGGLNPQQLQQQQQNMMPGTQFANPFAAIGSPARASSLLQGDPNGWQQN